MQVSQKQESYNGFIPLKAQENIQNTENFSEISKSEKSLDQRAKELLQNLLSDGQSGEKIDFNTLSEEEQRNLLDFTSEALKLVDKAKMQESADIEIASLTYTRIENYAFIVANFQGVHSISFQFSKSFSFNEELFEFNSLNFEDLFKEHRENSEFKQTMQDFFKDDFLIDELKNSALRKESI